MGEKMVFNMITLGLPCVTIIPLTGCPYLALSMASSIGCNALSFRGGGTPYAVGLFLVPSHLNHCAPEHSVVLFICLDNMID
jgi:hypothetical protein